MNRAQALLWPGCSHDTRREGIRLGLIMATAIWLWLALIDAIVGQPFHTFNALGGVVPFTIGHFLLNIVFGIALLSGVHGAARAPSLILGMVFVGLTFEGGIAMVVNILAAASLGNMAWIAMFGGNLIGVTIALTLLSRSHPLREYLHRAENET